MNPASKYLYHKFIDSPRRWHPLLAVYYLTYQCDFRCPYCSNGFNKPYHQLPKQILSADSVIEVLRRSRRNCDYIVITGGEPLKHPEFSEIMRRVNEIGFKDVALNTNGYEVDRFLPEIAKSVDTLIFSLDTLDEDKADEWFGMGPGTLKKIISNIMESAMHPARKYRILISSVITPKNIPDLYGVYAFAQKHGFLFAVCPELQGVKPPPELRENKEYEAFFDFLIAEKKKGRAIHGSLLYLRYMRDFNKFTCHPFTMVVIDPLGGVFYPCLEIGHIAGNILECDDLHVLRNRGLEHFGPQPECDARCHSACALGFSLCLEHPWSIIQEFCHIVRRHFAVK